MIGRCVIYDINPVIDVLAMVFDGFYTLVGIVNGIVMEYDEGKLFGTHEASSFPIEFWL
jgi:hypothetical protein